MKLKKPTVTQSIGLNIRKYRKEFGLNQEDLGGAVGLSRISIVNIEAGRQSAPANTLLEFCSVFGCTPNDLFPPVPLSKAQSSIVHIGFRSKKARIECLNNPEFVDAMKKLTTKAYYAKLKK